MRNREEQKRVAAAARQSALTDFTQVLDGVRVGADLPVVLARVQAARSLALGAGLSEPDISGLINQAFDRYFDEATAGLFVSNEQAAAIGTVQDALGLPRTLSGERYNRYVSSRCAAGRLPSAEAPGLLLSARERVCFASTANLVEEQDIRQTQNNYGGVSVPIGRSGVEFQVGESQGRSVVVGQEMVTTDSGRLIVTTTRIVFLGTDAP